MGTMAVMTTCLSSERQSASWKRISPVSGKRFPSPYPDGTAFQRRVWQSLCDIPYGRVISYRELAAQVGSPRAFQAVGQANGRNPLPILIPCHRVIAADGTLGGYSSGVERKRFLLRLEGLSIPESKPPRRVGKRGVRAR